MRIMITTMTAYGARTGKHKKVVYYITLHDLLRYITYETRIWGKTC